MTPSKRSGSNDSETCGCKIVGPAYDFRIAAIQYCDRHSPERVEKLEAALRNIVDAHCCGDDCSVKRTEIAEEALKLDGKRI